MNFVYLVRVNKEFYVKVLRRLRSSVRRRRPDLWDNQSWMLHHDNAPVNASILICHYLAKHQTTVLPHPPYTPDLATADFFLFPKLKAILKGRRFQTINDVEENTKRQLLISH